MPLLATSSGQRQFPWPSDSEDDSGPDGDGDGVGSPQDTREDNTLRVWWAGPLGAATEAGGDQSADAVEA